MERAFELHSELLEWDDSDYDRAEARDGVNWRLHLQLDALVLRRASDESLPDGAALRELQRRGRSKNDAVHQIALLVTEDLFDRMRQPPDAPSDLFDLKNAELNRKIALLAK